MITEQFRRAQDSYGLDGVGLLRRRRADQREVVRAGQVRPGRAAHRHDRLQRPVLHVVGGHRGQQGLRYRPRTAVPAGRSGREPRRSCWSGPTRRPPCRRPCSSSTRVGPPAPPTSWSTRGGRPRPPAPRLHLQPLPGTDLALANGLLQIAIKDGLIDADYIARRTRGFAGGQGRGRGLLAGPGGADHRGVGDRAAGHRAHPGRRRVGDDLDRPRAGAAQQRHRHRPGLHQPRPGPRPARASRTPATARSPARATARAAGSTARRPTSCPATASWPTPPTGRTWPRCGESTPTSCPNRGCRRSRCSTGWARAGGVRALWLMASNLVVSAPDVNRVRSPDRRPRLLRGVRHLRLRDGRAGRRRAADRPVGRGGGHHDQPGGPGDPPPPGAAAARGRPRRPDGDEGARRPVGSGHLFSGDPRGELRGAAARQRRRYRRLRRDQLGADRARAGGLLALSRC